MIQVEKEVLVLLRHKAESCKEVRCYNDKLPQGEIIVPAVLNKKAIPGVRNSLFNAI